MKNSSYYIAPVGDWTHDLPHTVASNMVKVSHATEADDISKHDTFLFRLHQLYHKGDWWVLLLKLILLLRIVAQTQANHLFLFVCNDVHCSLQLY